MLGLSLLLDDVVATEVLSTLVLPLSLILLLPLSLPPPPLLVDVAPLSVVLVAGDTESESDRLSSGVEYSFSSVYSPSTTYMRMYAYMYVRL